MSPPKSTRGPGSDRSSGFGARRRSIAFSTLGCKLNQYESDSLATRFQSEGWEIVAFSAPADVYVVNTCTVTNKADRKSRNAVNRAVRFASAAATRSDGSQRGALDGDGARSYPHGGESARTPLVVVTGCFAVARHGELEEAGHVLVVDNERKAHLFDIVDAHLRGETAVHGELPVDLFGFTPQSPVHRTRGLIKIQDGCDNFCTYCIIPFVRGRAKSRPLNEILEEARILLDRGYRELVLTGVNMSRYRWENNGFSHVLRALLELETPRGGADFRVRISSIEPDRIDEDFYGLLFHPRMTRHLHLCLQSGNDRILRAMRRQYDYAEFRAIVERIRALDPLFNITTDIITGFPGETDSEFADSLAAVAECRFGHVHVFPYSRRSGTAADRMDGQVNEKLRAARAKRIALEAAAVKQAYRERLVGTVQSVLIERMETWSVHEREPGSLHDTGLGAATGDAPAPDTAPAPGAAPGTAPAPGHEPAVGATRDTCPESALRQRFEHDPATGSGAGNTVFARGFGEYYVPVRFAIDAAADIRVGNNSVVSVRIIGTDAAGTDDTDGVDGGGVELIGEMIRG